MTDLWIYGLVAIAIYLTLPVLLLAHELGHAIPVLSAGGNAHISIGSTDGRTGSIGPATVTIGWEGVLSPIYYGSCRSSGVESRLGRVMTHLGGPLVTVGAALVFANALGHVDHSALRFGLAFVMYNQIAMAVLTLVPIQYPPWFGQYGEMTSDGYKALRTIRRSPQTE